MKENTNATKLIGTVVKREYGYKSATGEFDCIVLSIKRLNKVNSDNINVYCKKEAVFNEGDKVCVEGSFRSRTVEDNDARHCVLYVQATKVEVVPEETEDLNTIDLVGFICKPPIIRKTPKGRIICDFIIATHRKNGKSDYLPLIAWSKGAEDISKYKVGDKLVLTGRIQSRLYVKNDEERTAFEISTVSFSEAEK